MYFQSSKLLAIFNDNFLTPIYFSIPNPMWSEVLVTQLCPTLCDPMDRSTPSSSVCRVFQTRILQWVAILFSRGSFWPRDQTLVSCISGRFLTIWIIREAQSYISSVQSLSHVWLFATPWIAACQASLSITNSWSSVRLIKSVMRFSHLILCCPFLLLPPIPPSISLFQWVNSSHEVAKVQPYIGDTKNYITWPRLASSIGKNLGLDSLRNRRNPREATPA